MKILFISLSGAGDVLMSTPLAKEIKLNYPNSEVHYLVMQEAVARDILNGTPYINKIIYFNFAKGGIIKSLALCSKLKREKYDISITTYHQARYYYSIISYLIGAKQRVGFDYQTQRAKLNKLFFNRIVEENFNIHVVENNLNVLKEFGLKKISNKIETLLYISRKDSEFATSFLKKNKIDKFAVIHAGSGITKNFHLKRWPKENFSILCKNLSQLGLKIILVGGPEEIPLNKGIIKTSELKENKDIFILNADVKKSSAIIKRAKATISGDTIVGHIAAAVNTPVICLFGPTSWENTAPFTDKRVILSKRPENVRPYYHGRKSITLEQAKYMNEISVEEVTRAVRKILKETRSIFK